MVKTLKFGELDVPVPGLGCMSFSSAWGAADDTESKAVLARALELGCTFWDSAVAYGMGHNESLIGDFVKEHLCRDKVFVASKCGFEVITATEVKVTNSPAHINAKIDETISRLGFAPDLYYLHRVDPDTPLEESIPALNDLKQQGKCKFIGLSECGADTLRKACKIAHIDAIQVQYSAWCTDLETNGLLDVAKELGVAVVAYSPLGMGVLTGTVRSTSDMFGGDIDPRKSIPAFSSTHFPSNLSLVDAFTTLAAQKNCTPGQLALAWVSKQGSIAIPGTRRVERMEENWKSRYVELTDEDMVEIRRIIDNNRIQGDRLPELHMKLVGK